MNEMVILGCGLGTTAGEDFFRVVRLALWSWLVVICIVCLGTLFAVAFSIV
jgi:hypothetical protein